MPNPYELTALEDPADMYNELPRGGGRIAFPSGDVRTFQFEPPTPEDQNAALRAAAARAQQFDVLQRNAQQAALDKQEMEDLQANLRVENAAKAVQMAERFQARRAYEREMQAAESEGLTSLQAGGRAGARVPWALGSGAGSGAAAMVNAAREIPQPSFGETPGGREYVQTGRYGERIQFPPVRPADPNAMKSPAQLTYLRQQEAALTEQLNPLRGFMTSADREVTRKRRDEYRAAADALERTLLPGGTTGAAQPTRTAASSAGADSVFATSSEARAAGYGKGDKVRIRGVGIVQLR